MAHAKPPRADRRTRPRVWSMTAKNKVAAAPPDPDNDPMASPPKIILPDSVLRQLGTSEKDEPDVISTRPHLSYSQLSMYLRCSMQYFFRYVLGLKDKPKVSLSIGKGGHAALEWNTKKKIETGTDQPVEAVVQKASDFMDTYLRDLPASEYEKDVEPGETKDKFLAATKVFRTRDAPKITPIAAEVAFTLDLNQFIPDDEEPIRPIVGALDVLSTDRDLFVAPPTIAPIKVDDYKFVTRKKSQSEVDLSPQITLYNGVVKQIVGRWPSKAGLIQLHPGTTRDGPDAIPLSRSPDLMKPEAQESRLKRLVYQFRRAEAGIKAAIFIPTDNPITCSWCGFRERCQMSLVNDFEAATIRASTLPPTS